MREADAPPTASVVIPAYNRADLLARCLESLRRSVGCTWEATVVDNASPEDLSAVRAAFPEVRWLRCERNVGYAAANNLGLEGARGRFFCLLNADAELLPETLAALAAFLEAHPEAGAVAPASIGPAGEVQPSCSPEHGLLMAWLRDSGFHLLFPKAVPFRSWMLPDRPWSGPREVAHTQTTCLLVRREAHQAAGGMEPSLFLFYNDVDYCRRLRAVGWKVYYVPEVSVRHHGSASVETAPWKERQLWRDRYRYYARWYGLPGTLGVRFACLHRLVTRAVARLASGRLRGVPEAWREGCALYRALTDGRDGS